jgi:ribonuclease PH
MPKIAQAGVDGNFVLLGMDRMIEVQMSAEGSVFDRAQMDRLLDLAQHGAAGLVAAQRAALA